MVEVIRIGLFGTKPKIKCDCGASFASKDELNAHVKQVHKM